ncbi:MAG: TolC family protein [Ignavibacteriales bacterium]|nr:TolC family protein [Ignavibacteriales bacterium]
MKIENFLVIGILLLAATQIFPQQKLTLKEAINIALKNNYDILLAKNDAAISGNNYSLGNAGFLPKIDVTGSQTKTVTDTKQEYSDGRTVDKTGAASNSTNAGVALTWTIFDGLKMFTTYSKLREYKELGDLKLRGQIETSVSDVIQTYYNIVQQKYNYRVAKESISISEERVKLIEEKLSVGSASNLDLLRAKVDLNSDKSNMLNQEVTLNALKVTFNGLLARNVAIDFDVDETIDIKEGLSFTSLKEAAFKNNVDLLQSQKNINISSYDAGISKSDFFPRISLNSGYNYLNSAADANLVRANKSYGYNYGLSFSWNIFNGFNTQLAYQNALITLDKNEIIFQATKIEIESSLLISFKNYEKNLEILKLEEENVSTAKENLDLALEQLKLGSLSPLEFREVQKSYTAAQSRLSSARYAAKMSEKDLLKQSGELLQN